MRLLLSLTYYLPHISGITVYNHRLARGLVARGHQVTVLTSRYEPTLPAEEVLDGVRVIRVPVWFWISKGAIMPGFPLRFWRELRRHDAVVMNLPNTPVEALLGPAIARLLGKPLIAKHMCDIELPASPLNRVVNAVVRGTNFAAAAMADCVVSMTRDYARHSPVLRHFLRKLAVIPPPVEMAPVKREQADEWKHGREIDGGPLIGFAARLSTEKGVEVMLRALPLVLREFPRAIVLFAGEHEKVIGERAYRERLEPLLRQTAGNWRFLGLVAQEELPAFYTACDLTVLPSLNRTESFGIVQVESMLCGTPVVASNLPGVRDAIRRTGMGRVVPIGDSEALASAIVEVLRDRAAFVRPHAQLVRRYSTTLTCRHYERLVRECAGARQVAWTHLRAKPFFLALQRAVEHRELRRRAPFESPLLDVGTGDGHFGAVVLRGGIDIGIDSDANALRHVRKQTTGGRRAYRLLARCSAEHLPCAAGSIATIVSNSTLEHIPNLDGALRELHRVLRPGGRIILTVPTDRWNDALATPRMLGAIGLARAAQRYTEWFRRVQRHHHLLSAEEWTDRLRDAGFIVTHTRRYFPGAATGLLELLHYEGWHNLLSRALTGRWVLLPWRPLYIMPEWLIAGFVRDRDSRDPTCLLVEARKPQT